MTIEVSTAGTRELGERAEQLTAAAQAGRWRPGRGDRVVLRALASCPLTAVRHPRSPADCEGWDLSPVQLPDQVISGDAIREVLSSAGVRHVNRMDPAVALLLIDAAALQEYPSVATTSSGTSALVAVTDFVHTAATLPARWPLRSRHRAPARRR
ncbi:MAG: hypothetical protein JO362_24175 [Streptomycetaceae bacterium]|nr:hypothetical protein [Streptomycetaceae bacterium]